MAKEKTKLNNIGSWLKDGFAYVFANWLMLLKVYGWGMLIYFGSAILVAIVVGILFGITKVMGTSPVGIVLMILLGLVGVAGLLFILAMVGKMIYFQTKAAIKPIKSIREEWKKLSWKEGLGMYWLMFVMMLAVYGGFVLLIIPGFIIATMVSMAIFVRVEQNVKGIKALMLSRDYVKGYGWAVFGRGLLMGVIMIPIFWVIADLYQRMIQAGGAVAVLGFVLYLGFSALISFFMYRLSYLMYKRLVEIKGKLTLKTNGMRTLGWSLLIFAPFIVAIVVVLVLAAVNPKAQIEKAQKIKNEAIQKELLQSPLPSVNNLLD